MTTWIDPRHDGAGSWEPTPQHPSGLVDLIVAFTVCLLAVTLFIGLVVAARAGMCKAYSGRPDGPSYCQDGEVQ